MQTTPLEARVEREGETVLVSLTGDIDGGAEQELASAYDEAAAPPPAHVMLDFTEVGYVNSTGIALIVGLLARARADGIAVKARGLVPHYREIFEITRLSDFMEIVPDGPAASGGPPGTEEGAR